MTTHGLCGIKEYIVWKQMRSRCNNKNNPRYKYYGGRGIKICKRWSTFGNFYIDMGIAPSKKHSLERVNVNKGYSKQNCIWATHEQQMSNRTRFTNPKSGYVGIYYRPSRDQYMAMGFLHGRRLTLGCFNTKREAIAVRNKFNIDKKEILLSKYSN